MLDLEFFLGFVVFCPVPFNTNLFIFCRLVVRTIQAPRINAPSPRFDAPHAAHQCGSAARNNPAFQDLTLSIIF